MMLEAEKRVEFHQALDVDERICFSLDFYLWPWSITVDEYKYER